MLEPTPHVSGAKGEAAVHEPSAAERTVARRTAEARATIPDLELGVDVDMAAALERCRREPCSLDALLIRACAAALRAVPMANGAYRDGHFETYSRINIGYVVASADTYLIPVVFDADTRSLSALTTTIEQLRADAQARRLASPAFSGTTFTVWNAGPLGLARAAMVIPPPQAGALAAGAVRAVPVVRDGVVVPGQTMTVTLACDHRILYGAQAAALLEAVKTELEREPG